MAYDAGTSQVVLFGGDGQANGGAVLDDTWVYNGKSWVQQSPPVSPPARYLGAMTYDAPHQKVVLFGGASVLGGSTQSQMLSDTWTWNGATWTQQVPAISPSGRAAAAMTYDRGDGQVVLFGGFDEISPNLLGDTWTWDGSNWSQQFPASSPPARAYAGMSYVPTSDAAILFGGPGRSDTWSWQSGVWTQQAPPQSPSARYLFATAADDATGSVVLFGGDDQAQDQLGDTWAYSDHGTPIPR